MASFFETKIEFLKGVGPQKAALLNTELNIFTYGDLIQHYPFRYEDRSKIYRISEINEDIPNIQLYGEVRHIELVGSGLKKRLVVQLADSSGTIELVWFKGINWVVKKLKPGTAYLVFGKPVRYGSKYNIAHPEIDIPGNQQTGGLHYQPIYSTTEKLKRRLLDSKGIAMLQEALLKLAFAHIPETLPLPIMNGYKLLPKKDAVVQIHFPSDSVQLQAAQFRLKFEEFFYIQLRLLKLRLTRIEKYKGIVLTNTQLIKDFYHDHLPFTLTDAQKRVIKEAYHDMRSGKQMNRLLQGDVGSGKTMVAFICMLQAVGSQAQAALMAPTEILADQHFQGLKAYAEKIGIRIAKLTGSTKKKDRRILHEKLQSGETNILVGTHALLEDEVQFHKLGLAVVDEQHRFGVAQRAKLWQKTDNIYPHVLVMTATPIPRTLAMTLYGDLDVSVIDELPSGRKPIKTVHFFDSARLRLFGFLKEQIALGRQVYIVYPLIEESEKLDYNNLMEGYESISRAFPGVPISIVHGKMKPEDKDFEMQRFVRNETKIMVATTVIEVGVNVPNASVMVVENAERFGLAQLHQLRGRVGRGADQSYCFLTTGYKLSKEGRLRINTLVQTNNGFEIADIDLKLRGPGEITGTQQSGVLDLLIADLGKDGDILQQARQAAQALLAVDPELNNAENAPVRRQIDAQKKTAINWSRIS